MALITAKNLTLAYDNFVVAENINFTVNEGDYLCIVGENGSGKSTLMKTMLGFMKPYSGKIEFGDGLKQREIGYLPQRTDIQKDFPASVKEVVLSGNLNSGGFKPFFNRKDKKRTQESIDMLGLTGLENRSFQDLSGGQQQRVLLARALCATKKLLLLDEPVTGLDPLATVEMYDIIKDLNRKGITVIMISHDLNGVFESATHVLHMLGNSDFFGTKEEYLNSETGKRFLGGEAK